MTSDAENKTTEPKPEETKPEISVEDRIKRLEQAVGQLARAISSSVSASTPSMASPSPPSPPPMPPPPMQQGLDPNQLQSLAPLIQMFGGGGGDEPANMQAEFAKRYLDIMDRMFSKFVGRKMKKGPHD